MEFPPDRDTPDSIRRFGLLETFARCATQISGNAIAKALENKPMSSGERRLIELGDRLGGCGQSGAITRILSLVRGTYAEALYLKRFKTAPEPAAVDSRKLEKFLENERDFSTLREPQDRSLALVAGCLVALQPAVAQNIFESRHGGAREEELMNTIFREAPTCAGETRPTLVSRAFMRAFLGEAAYRYAMFAAPTKA
ncbi:hypothetical protein [uncultured Sphingomonas sp.]|uniref:hypothetical protein n=1 Tax=uncultured Sphingomonas sp. TaxID=158754 RepID=UPI0035C98F1D